MDLLTYITDLPAEARDELAASTGTKAVYLRQIAYGHRQPSTTLARALAEATGGAVTLHELRPDVWDAS